VFVGLERTGAESTLRCESVVVRPSLHAMDGPPGSELCGSHPAFADPAREPPPLARLQLAARVLV